MSIEDLFPTFYVGDEQSDKLNTVLRDNLDFLYDRPAFRVMHSADQSPTGGGTEQWLDFDDLTAPYCYQHRVTPHPSNDHLFKIDDGGIWRFTWSLKCTATTPTHYYVELMQDLGSLPQARQYTWCSQSVSPNSGSVEFAVPADGYVGLKISRPDSSSFTVNRSDYESPVFSGHWIREYEF